jgi:polyisoprenyl-phosphate glycosyltransferase
MRPLISIILPFYNEATCLAATVAEVQAVERKLSERFSFEYLLMDNHSTDGSREISLKLCKEFPNIRYFRHSRNFGFQANILAGFRNARGAAAVQLDADGEDDPQLIEAFLGKWEEGYKVVYGVRKVRHEPWLLSAQRKIFYRLLRYASEIPLPLDAGDFRLIDRQVVDFLSRASERNIYLRGLIAYAGFAQIGIDYERRPRHSGESKFSWFSYLGLATTGLTGFSKRPLLLITYFGALLFVLSLLLSACYLMLYLFSEIPVRGFTTLVLLQLFFAGVILMSIGITALYVGRIFDEVKARPHYIFEETA